MQFSLRIDENIINKIRYIARENGRSANKEIERLILAKIKEYETEYGEIDQEDIDNFFKSL